METINARKENFCTMKDIVRGTRTVSIGDYTMKSSIKGNALHGFLLDSISHDKKEADKKARLAREIMIKKARALAEIHMKSKPKKKYNHNGIRILD